MAETGTSELEDRIDQLESLVEEQQRRIAEQQRHIDRLREESDDSGSAIPLSRRNVLVGTGLVGLLAGGAGTAVADRQGQIGTQSDPLKQLYTGKLVFDDTLDDGDRFSITETGERSPGHLEISEGGALTHELFADGRFQAKENVQAANRLKENTGL